MKHPSLVLRSLLTVFLAALLLSLLTPGTSLAGSATWKASPASDLWNSAANWTPATIPNGLSDTATFAQSSQTAISFFDPITVGAIVFNTGASSYNFTVGPGIILDLAGAGVTDNAVAPQNFTATTDTLGNFGTITFSGGATISTGNAFTTRAAVLNGASGGLVQFTEQATAGSGTFFNEGALQSGPKGGETDFFDNASAASALLIADPGNAFSADGGTISFFGASTASSASLTANGGTTIAAFGGSIYFRENSSAAQSSISTTGGGAFTGYGPNIYFEDTASAGNAIINVNGGQGSGGINGATLTFLGSSTAGSATILVHAGGSDDAQPGHIYFFDDSSGGTARLELFAGQADFSQHNPGTVSVGSIESVGTVYLGPINLQIGGNNFADVFAGTMQELNAGSSGASLTKVGTNSLVLSGANGYNGGTTINSGSINVQARTGSATGRGPVQVNAGGTLGGFGTVSGPVTIGPGGSLSPGNFGTARLITKRLLTFGTGSNYIWEFNPFRHSADMTGGRGATISGDAKFCPTRAGSGRFPVGQVLIVVENDGSDPIKGTFSNLPDGSITRIGGNNFQASYEGGDGNDLTLTVVP